MRKLKSSVRKTPGYAQPSTGSAVLWKLFSFALIAVSVLFVVSCKSKATLSYPQTVPAPVAVPTLTPVPVDGDSATLEVKLRTDPSGAILMETLRQETSKRMSLQAQLDSLGNLKVKAKRKPDTAYVKGNDSLIYVPVPGLEKTVEVNVLTRWQKAMIWLGSVVLLILAALGLPKLLKLIITLLKRC